LRVFLKSELFPEAGNILRVSDQSPLRRSLTRTRPCGCTKCLYVTELAVQKGAADRPRGKGSTGFRMIGPAVRPPRRLSAKGPLFRE
jgi:hypothetical protein